MPINIVTVRRAFCMLAAGVARAVDRQYQTFDFHSWSELSAAVHDETIGMVDRVMRVPRVVLLSAYDRIPRRQVRFSRLNIILRDRHTCQYCGRKLKRSQLNVDHIVPRSQNGTTVWENVVTSCHDCNHRKGGRLPHEAGMKLIRQPTTPRMSPLPNFRSGPIEYDEWKPFFNIVDFSYWNVELER